VTQSCLFLFPVIRKNLIGTTLTFCRKHGEHYYELLLFALDSIVLAPQESMPGGVMNPKLVLWCPLMSQFGRSWCLQNREFYWPK
jgi:hypothetical protein